MKRALGANLLKGGQNIQVNPMEANVTYDVIIVGLSPYPSRGTPGCRELKDGDYSIPAGIILTKRQPGRRQPDLSPRPGKSLDTWSMYVRIRHKIHASISTPPRPPPCGNNDRSSRGRVLNDRTTKASKTPLPPPAPPHAFSGALQAPHSPSRTKHPDRHLWDVAFLLLGQH